MFSYKLFSFVLWRAEVMQVFWKESSSLAFSSTSLTSAMQVLMLVLSWLYQNMLLECFQITVYSFLKWLLRGSFTDMLRGCSQPYKSLGIEPFVTFSNTCPWTALRTKIFGSLVSGSRIFIPYNFQLILNQLT